MQHSDCNSPLADMLSPFNNTSMLLSNALFLQTPHSFLEVSSFSNPSSPPPGERLCCSKIETLYCPRFPDGLVSYVYKNTPLYIEIMNLLVVIFFNIAFNCLFSFSRSLTDVILIGLETNSPIE